jgi:hypothetical protein
MLRFIVLLALASYACQSDDSFGRNQQRPPGDDFTATTPPMLIGPGDTFAYTMTKTYDPDPISSSTAHEKSVFGQVCIKVASVDDGFPEARASSIDADVRATGASAAEDLFFEDQDNASASSIDVDAFMTPLWLHQLTFPTRGHGFNAPARRTFGTRESVAPPEQSMGRLNFFDVRDDDDHGWNGWSDYSVDFFAWVDSEFSTAETPYYESDDVDFDVKSALGCEEATSSANCPAAQCLWDFQANACIGQLQIEVAWRDNITIPSEFAGNPVIHWVKFGYTVDGWLRNYDEVIRPDTTAGAPVNIQNQDFTQCEGDGFPCAKARIDSRTWSGSACAF